MVKKVKKEAITIPRKAMFGIAPAVVIIALLLSKRQPGELLLFLVGISAGIFICKGFFGK
jgi:hypothetical protein